MENLQQLIKIPFSYDANQDEIIFEQHTGDLEIDQIKQQICNSVQSLMIFLLEHFRDISKEKKWVYIEEQSRCYAGSLPKILQQIDNKADPFGEIFRYLLNYGKQKELLEQINPKLSQISSISSSIDSIPYKMMEICITAFFKKFFKQDTIKIDFNDKGHGIHFGMIADIQVLPIINTQPSNTIRYYIKTHEQGLKSIYSSALSVSPLELFIYKTLEISEFGVASYFPYYDQKNFYIVTLNAGEYSSKPNDKQFYKTYERFLDTQKDTILPQYSHCHSSISKCLMDANILSKILYISDVTNNNSNIVLVQKGNLNDDKWKLKIIDFKLKRWDPISISQGCAYFFGTVSGSVDFTYSKEADKFKTHYLETEGLKERIEHAKNFDYQNILTSMNAAEQFINRYIQVNTHIFTQNTLEKFQKEVSYFKLLVQTFKQKAEEYQL